MLSAIHLLALCMPLAIAAAFPPQSGTRAIAAVWQECSKLLKCIGVEELFQRQVQCPDC